MSMEVLHDISPPIDADLAVWPGDTPISQRLLMKIEDGDSVRLSTMTATVHLGSHADAPCHYARDGHGIEQWPLSYFIGPCQVMHVDVQPGELVGVSHLTDEIRAGRVLLAGGSYPDATHFNEDFCALDPALVDHLHEQGVMTVGVDTPSVDPFDSKELPAHTRFYENEMAIIETLQLSGVPNGIYQLVAPPLKLVGFDASPVRAVLCSI